MRPMSVALHENAEPSPSSVAGETVPILGASGVTVPPLATAAQTK